jgi:hypothetical protein
MLLLRILMVINWLVHTLEGFSQVRVSCLLFDGLYGTEWVGLSGGRTMSLHFMRSACGIIVMSPQGVHRRIGRASGVIRNAGFLNVLFILCLIETMTLDKFAHGWDISFCEDLGCTLLQGGIHIKLKFSCFPCFVIDDFIVALWDV